MVISAWRIMSAKNLFRILVLISMIIIVVYFIFSTYYNESEVNHVLKIASQWGLQNYTRNRERTKAERRKRTRKNQKEQVLLFIGIISAPRYVTRRNALRRSWFSYCKHNDSVACWIFTDAQDTNGNRLPGHIYIPLKQEQFLHNDLVFTETPGGINFARRYLWILNWANKRYKFDYLLRVDDDYFVCLERLLLELPFRQKKKLYWGHVHCKPKGGIRVDEGFVIVSNDLVQRFLKEENRTLICHPYGDQAMAMWINNISGVTYFHDRRIYHDLSATNQMLLYQEDICGQYLALHESYPVEIEIYWFNYSWRKTKNFTIPTVSYPCGNDSKIYNKDSFEGYYHGEPMPCKDNPIWNIAPFYPGRMPSHLRTGTS